MTVSYFEWVQNRTATYWDADRVDTELRQHMRSATARVLAQVDACDGDLRAASYAAALKKLAEVYAGPRHLPLTRVDGDSAEPPRSGGPRRRAFAARPTAGVTAANRRVGGVRACHRSWMRLRMRVARPFCSEGAR